MGLAPLWVTPSDLWSIVAFLYILHIIGGHANECFTFVMDLGLLQIVFYTISNEFLTF